MREYVAKTGGRYTYIEDFIGLQELSLSLASILMGARISSSQDARQPEVTII